MTASTRKVWGMRRMRENLMPDWFSFCEFQYMRSIVIMKWKRPLLLTTADHNKRLCCDYPNRLQEAEMDLILLARTSWQGGSKAFIIPRSVASTRATAQGEKCSPGLTVARHRGGKYRKAFERHVCIELNEHRGNTLKTLHQHRFRFLSRWRLHMR